jgi:RNA polymerase sigma-70 factor (ECF subfamily)
MQPRSANVIDELLVMQAQDGDRRALEELVRRWQQRLWVYARRLTGSPEAAWDVTQQSWLTIIRGLGKLHDAACFRSWAYRIVTNKAVDQINSRRPTQPLTEVVGRDDPGEGEALSSLAAVLERLEPRKRALLALHYCAGLTVAEIGHVLGIPPGTVKSRLHSARNEIRQLWPEGRA